MSQFNLLGCCLSCVKRKIQPPINGRYHCPYCCKGWQVFSIQQLNNTEYKFYDIFDIICQYCQVKQNFFKYRKHEEKCYQKQQNKFNLKENVELEQIFSQEQNSDFQSCQFCDSKLQQMLFCQNCHFKIKMIFIEEDIITVLKYWVQCQICKQFIEYSGLDNHKYNCLEAFVQCDICQINIQRKNYLEHYKICTNNKINKLQLDTKFLLYTFNNFYYLKQQQIETDYLKQSDKFFMLRKKISKYYQEQT